MRAELLAYHGYFTGKQALLKKISSEKHEFIPIDVEQEEDQALLENNNEYKYAREIPRVKHMKDKMIAALEKNKQTSYKNTMLLCHVGKLHAHRLAAYLATDPMIENAPEIMHVIPVHVPPTMLNEVVHDGVLNDDKRLQENDEVPIRQWMNAHPLHQMQSTFDIEPLLARIHQTNSPTYSIASMIPAYTTVKKPLTPSPVEEARELSIYENFYMQL